MARLWWWLLPHIGYYCDDTEHWRWWMRPARWAWRFVGWLPGSDPYEPMQSTRCDCDDCMANLALDLNERPKRSEYGRRDTFVSWACNWLLRYVATEKYRMMIGGAIRYGMVAAARDHTAPASTTAPEARPGRSRG